VTPGRDVADQLREPERVAGRFGVFARLDIARVSHVSEDNTVKVVVILEADDKQLIYDHATLEEEPSTIVVRRGTGSIARFSKRDVKSWYTEP
jgi:hypothetical protein